MGDKDKLCRRMLVRSHLYVRYTRAYQKIIKRKSIKSNLWIRKETQMNDEIIILRARLLFWFFFLKQRTVPFNTPECRFPVKQSEAIYWWTECSILHLEKRREDSAQQQAGWYKAWTPCFTCACLRIRDIWTGLRQQSVFLLVKNQRRERRQKITLLLTCLLHGFSRVYTRSEIFSVYILMFPDLFHWGYIFQQIFAGAQTKNTFGFPKVYTHRWT